MLWGCAESCPEGDDWKRALHALGAMRRMCRGAQTRYIKIRLRKSRVNSLFSARPSHQKAGHRAIAQVVPRAGVVNARRPGRRPGRSEAKSIDDAEHGASMKRAMVRCLDLDLQRDVSPGTIATRTNLSLFCLWAALPANLDAKRAHGQRVCPARRCAETATSDMTNDGVNDPVSTALGSLAGQDTGVVHAIVGSPTATPTPTVTAAQSAAAVAGPEQTAAIQTLARRESSRSHQG